jgi:MFS family permease
LLTKIYGKAYTNSTAKRNVSSLTFVGTVVGQLVFGYTADKWSRKNSLLVSTAILFVFAVLATGSYGAGGTPGGLFAALTAYRFLLGIGIGGEYPAGSVAAAEASGETKRGTRNTWFVMFTNVAIDWGFVIGAFVSDVRLGFLTQADNM